MKKILGLVAIFPFIAMAAEEPQPGTIPAVISVLRSLVDSIIPLFMVVAGACFLWGVIQYITAAGDEEKIKSARGYLIYGLIGLFVMVAFWGIISVFAETFGIQVGGTIPLPTVTP